MNRRGFLSFLRGAPIAAIPTLAVSGLAMMKSSEAAETLEKIALTKDGVSFNGCRFNVGGHVQLVGDRQTINQCSFNTGYDCGPAVSVISSPFS